MWQLEILLYALMPLCEQNSKEGNVEETKKYVNKLLFDQKGSLTSVLTFLEYYSFSGISEGINTDLFTNCKCICLNAAV